MSIKYAHVAAIAMVVACRLVTAAEPAAEDVFARRILPIFNSPNPSSCTQCHLAGVDLKQYIRPSEEATFVSLREQGLVDIERPENSKILKLINMREANQAGAALIQEKTRQAEYAAFAEWLKVAAADPKLREVAPPAPERRPGPERPLEIIRHARKDRLLESFENNIWAMRFRCMGCHVEGSESNDKLRQKHGDRVAWIKSTGPQATMEYLLASRLIDVQHPERSLLLLKPLNEVKHGGGKKFIVGDQGYQAFRGWLDDYAMTVADRYSDAASLPKPDGLERFGTDVWIKLSNLPAEWGDSLLQADIHAWAPQRNEWDTQPIASTDRAVWGKGRQWQHTLTLSAPADSAQAKTWRTSGPSLPADRYLMRVYVDRAGRKARDWQARLGQEDYVGQVEVQSAWPAGYGKMTIVDADRLEK
ncbi:MAG: hypothetical protein HY288_18945 [Planctomycetia bacterium]|nr:hypothetical protein [Planctomycetia bacterium]